MKKTLMVVLSVLFLLLPVTTWAGGGRDRSQPQRSSAPPPSPYFTGDGLTIPRETITQELASFQGKNNVLRFQPASGGYGYHVFEYDLSPYVGQFVEISVSAQMWLDTPAIIHWQINIPEQNWPLIAGNIDQLTAGRWHSIQGSNGVTVQRGNVLYLTSWNFNNASGYIADLDIKITPIILEYDNNVPSLYTKWPFHVGTAVWAGGVLPSNPTSGLLRHFNIFTLATLYPSWIMPSPWTPTGAYRWASTDELLNYAEANGKKVRGHTLFYHQTTPIEFFKGSGRDGWATKEELYARMEHHARTVFQKYRGRIEYWDVFNEPVGNDGNPRSAPGRGADSNIVLDNYMWDSLYTQIMENAGYTGIDRYEYVLKAFQLARQYADANGGQNVKLILNETDIETDRVRQAGFLRLLDYLIANNAPIDGVGIQGHINYTAGRTYIRELERLIDAISAKKNPITGQNLIVQITELDISLFNDRETDWNNRSASRRTLTNRELNTRLRQQTTLYRRLFDMFEQKYNQGKLDMVIIWGVADRESALNWFFVQGRTDYPLLFDRNYQPKPAFHELIRGR